MVEITIEMRRKIAARLGLTTHTLRRSTQKGGGPLAAHHRQALIDGFGTEVADLLCPVRERARKGEKPPRKPPAWAEVLMELKSLRAEFDELRAKVRFLEVEQIASLFGDVGQIDGRVEAVETRVGALETARLEEQWKTEEEP